MKVKIDGFAASIKDLNRFVGPEKLKLLKVAMRAAGSVLAKELRKLTGQKGFSRSGTTKKSISHKLKYYKKSDTLILNVGVKSWVDGMFNGKKVIAHKYGHLWLSGHKAFMQKVKIKPHSTFRMGKYGAIHNPYDYTMIFKRRVGAAKPNNLLYRALKDASGKALQVARKKVRLAIEKLIGNRP